MDNVGPIGLSNKYSLVLKGLLETSGMSYFGLCFTEKEKSFKHWHLVVLVDPEGQVLGEEVEVLEEDSVVHRQVQSGKENKQDVETKTATVPRLLFEKHLADRHLSGKVFKRPYLVDS